MCIYAKCTVLNHVCVLYVELTPINPCFIIYRVPTICIYVI